MHLPARSIAVLIIGKHLFNANARVGFVGRGTQPDRKAFGGSIATGDRLVRTMMKLAGVDVVNAVKMMTATPAHYMGIDNERGTLAQGKRADIVLFDQDVNVKQVFLGGEAVL